MKQFYSLCMIMLLASVLAIDVMGQKTTLTVTGKVTDLEETHCRESRSLCREQRAARLPISTEHTL